MLAVVVDANVLFSALLAKGLTRKLMEDERLLLYSPKYLAKEFAKYYDELMVRSKLDSKEFSLLAQRLMSKIKLVNDEEILPFLYAANTLTADRKDVPYLACALAIGADVWSHDTHLKQKRVKCWSTAELAEELGLLSK